ncbi:hypothetical protein EPO15_12705 [bacterium]|nr:MAG: hypothetical protein EPO15_12705 [bacterium]
MKRALLVFVLLPFAMTACDDTPQKAKPAEDDGGGMRGASGTPSGGSGDVAISGASEGTIADRYEKALKMIKEKDWDGARDQLQEAYRRSDSADVKKEIQGHLAMVEQGILAQPTVTGPDIFAFSAKVMEKHVSMRGKLLQGGPVAKVTYYFWLESGAKVQCRFPTLSLEDKKLILGLADGAQVLVRGTVKPPWGSNPNPYLELNYFKLEKRAPEPAKPEAPLKGL